VGLPSRAGSCQSVLGFIDVTNLGRDPMKSEGGLERRATVCAKEHGNPKDSAQAFENARL
jgi:hypothetical protein